VRLYPWRSARLADEVGIDAIADAAGSEGGHGPLNDKVVQQGRPLAGNSGASWSKLRYTHPFEQVKISIGVCTAQLREKGKQILVGRGLTCAGPPKAFTMHLGH
jgi:hypothetical protein